VFAPRSKGKQAKKGQAAAARKWGFVAQMKRTDVYRQYFDPTPAVEWQAMQLQPEVRSIVKHRLRSDAVAGHGHSGYRSLSRVRPRILLRPVLVTGPHLGVFFSPVDALLLTAHHLPTFPTPPRPLIRLLPPLLLPLSSVNRHSLDLPTLGSAQETRQSLRQLAPPCAPSYNMKLADTPLSFSERPRTLFFVKYLSSSIHSFTCSTRDRLLSLPTHSKSGAGSSLAPAVLSHCRSS
jgi:hypothetical protein